MTEQEAQLEVQRRTHLVNRRARSENGQLSTILAISPVQIPNTDYYSVEVNLLLDGPNQANVIRSIDEFLANFFIMNVVEMSVAITIHGNCIKVCIPTNLHLQQVLFNAAFPFNTTRLPVNVFCEGDRVGRAFQITAALINACVVHGGTVEAICISQDNVRYVSNAMPVEHVEDPPH